MNPNTTKSGPLSAASETPFKFQGIRTSIAKRLYIFVIFQGGGGLDPCPLWIRACNVCKEKQLLYKIQASCLM